jgi:hypothetical protein
MADKISDIVAAIVAETLVALKTSHTQASLSIEQVLQTLSDKSNIGHTHVEDDITDLLRPIRVQAETTVGSDGSSIGIPWAVESVNSLDLFINQVIQYPSSFSLNSSGNQILLNSPSTAGLPVLVTWYAAQAADGSIVSQPSQDDTPGGNTGPTTVFTSTGADAWSSSGAGLPDGSTIFQCISPDPAQPGGFNITQSSTIYNGYSAETWLTGGTGTVDFNYTNFVSAPSTDFASSGIGLLDSSTIFQSSQSTVFSSSGAGLTDSDTILKSPDASTWA